ncbi:DMT family transporter [Myxococcota bacterium]|nr:DMT family transporter [Myxococcota bacterium]
MPPSSPWTWPALIIAVLAISAAAVLARLAPEVHPVAMAFWRTAAVALLLAPALRRPAPGDGPATLAAGVCLALHFWAWFASLQETSVLRSTVLVCLTPLWVGVAESVARRAPPSPRWTLGVVTALVGVGVMAWGAPGPTSAASLRGDGLALLGGVLAAAYLLFGRAVRPRVGFLTYGAQVCLVCALTLAPLAAVLGAPLRGYGVTSWWALAAMALGPQLLGHVLLNFSVKYVSASVVAAMILLEPVGASALAALALGEAPTAGEALGGLVILLGVGLATRP